MHREPGTVWKVRIAPLIDSSGGGVGGGDVAVPKVSTSGLWLPVQAFRDLTPGKGKGKGKGIRTRPGTPPGTEAVGRAVNVVAAPTRGTHRQGSNSEMKTPCMYDETIVPMPMSMCHALGLEGWPQREEVPKDSINGTYLGGGDGGSSHRHQNQRDRERDPNVLLQPLGALACPVRVLSDVDDTAYANYVDYSMGPRVLAPGMAALYAALQSNDGQGHTSSRSHVGFVTARPPAMRSGSINGLSRLLDAGHLDVSVLPGGVCSLWTHGMMAERKMVHLREQALMWPDCRFVWMGDSGQGDAELGRMARRSFAGELGREPPVCLIHDVCPRSGLGIVRKTPVDERRRMASEGLFVFDCRADAALLAAQCGLCELADACRVAAAEAEEFSRMLDGLVLPSSSAAASQPQSLPSPSASAKT